MNFFLFVEENLVYKYEAFFPNIQETIGTKLMCG